MITLFHFLRPYWLLAGVPLFLLAWLLCRKTVVLQAWRAVCDRHLLHFLMQQNNQHSRVNALFILLFSAVFMIIALAGPTWTKLPVPTYRQVLPRVLVLDLSDNMLENDLKPNRLTRAKFKLHDLLQKKEVGQFGLVAFSGEPFTIAPLTEDGATIDALLSSLSPEVMPVSGYHLSSALEQAEQLINQAGLRSGEMLVLTAEIPTKEDIKTASTLAKEGIHISIMPMTNQVSLSPRFAELAAAGQGLVIRYTDTSKDLDRWILNTQQVRQFLENTASDIPLWRDEGRWFLIPALLLLLPVFRRGWLQRIKP